MKTITFITILLALVLTIPACVHIHDDDDCLYGNGNIVSRDIFVPAFDKVHLNGAGNVYITQGNAYRVTVETDQNLIDDIETDVYAGVWEIEFDRCVREISVLNVFITTPHLLEAVINGSGSMRSENVILEPELHLAVNGSGSLDFAFDGEAISTTVNGTADIFLEGDAKVLDHVVSGWCELQAFDLVADKVYIQVEGTGRSEVTALDLLDVIISGAGDVYFKGDPDIVSSISGSGHIINSN